MIYIECFNSMLQKFRSGDPKTVEAFKTEEELIRYLRFKVLPLYIQKNEEEDK